MACAQRGWVNVDMDKIECESCGAHLIFSVLTSWSPAEGMFFFEKMQKNLRFISLNRNSFEVQPPEWRDNSAIYLICTFADLKVATFQSM